MSRYLFVALAAVVSAWIGTDPLEAEELVSEPRIEYQVSPEFMVLELTSIGSLTTDPELGPFLRVYGDGRAHVRLPSYHRESGDFEAYLSHSDVRRLLSLCVQNGLMEFDQRKVKQQEDAATRERLREKGMMPGVADAGLTILRIRLSHYSPPGSSTVVENIEKDVSWRALSDVVSWYPEIRALAQFQEVVEVLRAVRSSTIEASKNHQTMVVLPGLGEDLFFTI